MEHLSIFSGNPNIDVSWPCSSSGHVIDGFVMMQLQTTLTAVAMGNFSGISLYVIIMISSSYFIIWLNHRKPDTVYVPVYAKTIGNSYLDYT